MGSDHSSSANMPVADQEQRSRAVVLRFENEFKNRGNYDVVDALFAESYQGHGLLPTPLDRAGLKALGHSIGAAFGNPQVNATVAHVITSGDQVVTRIIAQGKHVGAFNGIPPTNKDVTWTEIHIYSVKGDRIVESWSEVNVLAILTQIGAIPSLG